MTDNTSPTRGPAPEDPGAEDAGAEDAGAEGVGAEDASTAEAETTSTRLKRLEDEGDAAADFLEELLDIADLDGDIDLDIEGDRASVSIVGADLGSLVGEAGGVLEALQELTRLAVYRQTGERSRLMLDIAGHRLNRRAAINVTAKEAVSRVRSSGEAAHLDPMPAFDRKVVHDAVADAGLRSESEGEEPHRRVVILPPG